MKARKAPRKGARGKPAAEGPVFLFPGPEGWESWSQEGDGESNAWDRVRRRASYGHRPRR